MIHRSSVLGLLCSTVVVAALTLSGCGGGSTGKTAGTGTSASSGSPASAGTSASSGAPAGTGTSASSGSPSTSATGSREPSSSSATGGAKTCTAGHTQATINGKSKCLAVGQQCSSKAVDQYPNFGYVCSQGTNGRFVLRRK